MKENKIKWIKSALDDLREIKTFIGKSSPKYAKLQTARIILKIEIIRQNPRAGSQITEVTDKEVRSLVYGNYRIIYLIVNEEEIHIIRIWHTSRDFKSENDLE